MATTQPMSDDLGRVINLRLSEIPIDGAW